MASTASSTAFSMPRLIDIGLAPAATLRSPSFTIACARTVAVVVPSPATSSVFFATSLTSSAPIFSIGSSSSISFAMDTPSFVIVGAPHFFSSTTLRPLGPSVIFTAFASWSMPRSSARRASSSKLMSLGSHPLGPPSPYVLGFCSSASGLGSIRRLPTPSQAGPPTASTRETRVLRILGASSREWQTDGSLRAAASRRPPEGISSAPMSARPAWTLRFTHPTIEQVAWASAAPDHAGGGDHRGRQHAGLGVGPAVGRAAACLTRWRRRRGGAHPARRLGRRVVVRRGRERARAVDGDALRGRRRAAALPRVPRRVDDGPLR